jgi:hypothetical protein
LRDADAEPCDVCDALRRRRRALQVVWNPRELKPAVRLSARRLSGFGRRLQTMLGFFV